MIINIQQVDYAGGQWIDSLSIAALPLLDVICRSRQEREFLFFWEGEGGGAKFRGVIRCKQDP